LPFPRAEAAAADDWPCAVRATRCTALLSQSGQLGSLRGQEKAHSIDSGDAGCHEAVRLPLLLQVVALTDLTFSVTVQ
jgi:hypothetical protein